MWDQNDAHHPRSDRMSPAHCGTDSSCLEYDFMLDMPGLTAAVFIQDMSPAPPVQRKHRHMGVFFYARWEPEL